jgi:hypothetical protein
MPNFQPADLGLIGFGGRLVNDFSFHAREQARRRWTLRVASRSPPR